MLWKERQIYTDKSIQCYSLFNFSKINCFVTWAWCNYRLLRVKSYIIYWAVVAWQLVQYASWCCVPDINKSVCWTCRYLGAISWPCTPQKIFLKVVLVSCDDFHTALLRSKRTDIPNAELEFKKDQILHKNWNRSIFINFKMWEKLISYSVVHGIWK